MELNLNLCRDNGDPLPQPTRNRKLVGALIYFSTIRSRLLCGTYPESVCQCPHIDTLCGSSSYTLLSSWNHDSISTLPFKFSFTLQPYSDVGWANDPNTRRSTTGFCIFLGSFLISLCSKRQDTVARFSTEAEYRAIADASIELKWLCDMNVWVHFISSYIVTIRVSSLLSLV